MSDLLNPIFYQFHVLKEQLFEGSEVLMFKVSAFEARMILVYRKCGRSLYH